jgi:hypothetical protein
MVDIREGDILVIGTKEYPVKACSDWAKTGTYSASFQRLATISATTKRATTSGDKRLAASTYLTGLTVTPLDPVSAELASTMGLDTPHELLQTFIADTTGFLQLILEDLKE